ncbi:uncharacterized protein RSE6_00784 [Rhynchosporium secalis]|uniref:2EXR domain-containing protein n=1 Tax=Rhynchosporium secalis TaxID=38038 RepID=A0A1E1LXT5_RHYSE|nr:uncharacterized protein RSE6_00784 [Rhynchosporium secalis]
MPPKSQQPAKAKFPAKAKAPTKVKIPAKAKSPAQDRTRPNTRASTTTLVMDGPIILKEFPIFSKLPAELQLLVWKHSHTSRIVTLKPSKSSFPPLLHACTNSRDECILANYKTWIRDMKTGFVYSAWRDILLLDKTSFSESIDYHNNAFHTMKCKQVNLKMLEPVEKLAFSLQEVAGIWRQECFHCFLSQSLEDFFPNLKELIIILRPGPSGATYDDLYEVKDSTITFLQTSIADIKIAFKHAQEDGYCKDVVLRMMRVENWAR